MEAARLYKLQSMHGQLLTLPSCIQKYSLQLSSLSFSLLQLWLLLSLRVFSIHISTSNKKPKLFIDNILSAITSAGTYRLTSSPCFIYSHIILAGSAASAVTSVAGEIGTDITSIGGGAFETVTCQSSFHSPI